MCPLHEYLQAQLLKQPDSQGIPLDRKKVEALLAACTDHCFGGGSDQDPPALTVAAFSKLIGEPLSTVRAWCQKGLFGMENQLKVGREWVIPGEQVELTKSRYRAGWRVVKNKWVQPGAPLPTKKDEKSLDGAGAEVDKSSSLSKATAKSGAVGPATHDRPDYGGYRHDSD
jgi:hypothetical protein